MQEHSHIKKAMEPLFWSAGETSKIVVEAATPVLKEVVIPLVGSQMRRFGITSFLWDVVGLERVNHKKYAA